MQLPKASHSWLLTQVFVSIWGPRIGKAYGWKNRKIYLGRIGKLLRRISFFVPIVLGVEKWAECMAARRTCGDEARFVAVARTNCWTSAFNFPTLKGAGSLQKLYAISSGIVE
jgi:hypothetical protein